MTSRRAIRSCARRHLAVAAVAAASLSCARVSPVSRCPATAAPAAPPRHVWSTVLGDGARQGASAIDVDRSGNAHVVGSYEHTFLDAGGGVIRSSTRWGMFVQKLDPDGRPIWVRHFGGDGGITRGRAVRVDSSGNVLVAGSTVAASIDFGGGALRNAAPGGNDVFVVALGPDGRYLWSRMFGGAGDEWISPGAMALDASDHVHVAFRGVSGGLDPGSGPVASSGPPRTAVLLELDPGGAVLRSSRFGGAGDDQPVAIAVGSRGTVFVASERQTRVPGHDVAHRQAWLIEIDASGRELWSRDIGARTVGAAAAGCDDVLYVTGIAGGGDILLSAFGPGGRELWSRTFGTEAHEQPWDLVVDPCGDLVLAGDYGTPPLDLGGGALPTGEPVMLFLAGLDGSGAHLWSRGFRGTNTGVPRSLALSPSGDLWLAGELWGSSIDLGGGPLVHRGLGDVVLARYARRARCAR